MSESILSEEWRSETSTRSRRTRYIKEHFLKTMSFDCAVNLADSLLRSGC
jgi:hypothetical protein